MPRDLEAEGDYRTTLDLLKLLAQRDLLAWWNKTNGMSWTRRREVLEEPFAEIISLYGEQAAYAAADYLFIQRSLDEELRGEAYPQVMDPADPEQAQAAFRAGTRVENQRFRAMMAGDAVAAREAERVALSRLQAITNRLVVEPARETVWQATVDAGTRFARVPNPDACPFCLMLASRGAVYTRDTAVRDAEGNRYHDNCHCLAIEVHKDEDLPRINRDLEAAWRDLDEHVSGPVSFPQWENYMKARKQQERGEKWPRSKYAMVPKYSRKTSIAFPGEPLPPLDRMVGHVLHGWQDEPSKRNPGKPHTEALNMGHRYGTKKPKATSFPEDWTDQKIVDAVRDTIENPDMFWSSEDQPRREVYKEVDGILIRATYDVVTGEGKITTPTGYPFVKKIPREVKHVR